MLSALPRDAFYFTLRRHWVIVWLVAGAWHADAFLLDHPLWGQPPPEDRPAASQTDSENWATRFLEENPLAQQKTIRLADIQRVIDDPSVAERVLTEEFARVQDATPEEKTAFLTTLLRHPSPRVRAAAALQLEQLGQLRAAVEALLMELLADGVPQQREAAIMLLAAAKHPLPAQQRELLPFLVELLGEDDQEIAEAAGQVLRHTGAAAVPDLLIALDDPAVARQAAGVLGRILSPDKAPIRAQPVADTLASATMGKARLESMASAQLTREFTRDEPVQRRVYFGTNRALEAGEDRLWEAYFWPLVMLVIGIGWLVHVALRIAALRRSPHRHALQESERLKPRHYLVSLLALGLITGSILSLNHQINRDLTSREGPRFAGTRSDARQVYYGYCDVSIPPCHEEGVIEQPLIGPANAQRHVVLQRVDLLEEEAFFAELRKELKPFRNSKDCFVFVHGYNVSFDSAAMRTAQMLHDLNFQGLGIFYSWPSRASLPHYFSDRHEIAYSHRLIKQFLVDVVERTEADRVHVIAHSMGADAVCQALMEIDETQTEFHQIILAAPDIDRELFSEDIAPYLRDKGERTTLYCSRNDVALYASYHFNGYPRAGDSNFGFVVAEGLDTVDASDIDTELIGHSYYANGLPLLNDFAQLMTGNLPPPARSLQPAETEPGRVVWKFPARDSDPEGNGDRAGETNAGETNAGETNAGETNAGETNAGESNAGDIGQPSEETVDAARQRDADGEPPC